MNIFSINIEKLYMGIKSINPFLKEKAPGAFMKVPLTLFSVEDKLISAGSGDSEPLIVWEPERVRSDVIRNNVGRNAVSGNDEDRNEVFEKHGMFYKNEVNRNGTSLRNNNAIIERGTRPWWEE